MACVAGFYTGAHLFGFVKFTSPFKKKPQYKYSVIERWMNTKDDDWDQRVIMSTNSKEAAEAFLLPYDMAIGKRSTMDKYLRTYIIVKNKYETN